MPAMVEDATSQPIGRCSIFRPRIALRMMMNGPAKTHKRQENTPFSQVSTEIANFNGSPVKS